jgi:hypothetical protein
VRHCGGETVKKLNQVETNAHEWIQMISDSKSKIINQQSNILSIELIHRDDMWEADTGQYNKENAEKIFIVEQHENQKY